MSFEIRGVLTATQVISFRTPGRAGTSAQCAITAAKPIGVSELSLPEFYRLLFPLLLTTVMPLPDGMDELAALDEDNLDEDNLENESFSKRLITGAAAEGFFESSFPKLADFTGHILTNVN